MTTTDGCLVDMVEGRATDSTGLDRGRDLPEHVTMPLLSLVTGQSLDQDYAFVARRKREAARQAAAELGGPPGAPATGEPGTRGSMVALVAALAMFGLLVSTAAVQTSRNAAVDETSRDALIAQIEAKRDTLRRQQTRAGDLQAKLAISQARNTEAATADKLATGRLTHLQGGTGFGPVTGPGLRITVDDAGPGPDDAKVQDSDLALLADALWGVGAEAVSINGQRLTALTAIRNASAAIHVNGRPLAPPYVVLALGDPRTMPADLLDSARGGQFANLVSNLGLKWHIDNEASVTLPAARPPALRFTSTDTTDTGGAKTQGETS